MAKSPSKPSIDEARIYKVVLTRSIKVGRSVVNPGNGARLRGDVLQSLIAAHPDAVSSYEAA